MPYFIAAIDEENGTVVFLKEQLKEKTDVTWFNDAIESGLVFMYKTDFEITKQSIESNGG